jgi:hypothetical protein
MREVRWRLFRDDELPARLRRIQRMERAAFPLEDPGGAGGHESPAGPPGSPNGGPPSARP